MRERAWVLEMGGAADQAALRNGGGGLHTRREMRHLALGT